MKSLVRCWCRFISSSRGSSKNFSTFSKARCFGGCRSSWFIKPTLVAATQSSFASFCLWDKSSLYILDADCNSSGPPMQCQEYRLRPTTKGH
jgi:hypothetical protein